ncbi:MAG: type II toxin-antitoxin system prevent-host-death family antitoxin [Betaproteobacteria bacterium]|nr:type II toxin-antitoxin system prevent-host-death family antitoxin [Betaproteobacteria bacterium]
MEKVQLFEAKARLSELVDRAEAGREVVITRRGRAVARIVPTRRGSGRREVDRDAIVDEIEAFARTVKVKARFSLKKLIEAGRK